MKEQKNMKILIDTNILLDVLCNRERFLNSSLKIFKLCETKKIKGFISSLSIPNIIYIMRKELDSSLRMEIVKKLCLMFEVIELNSTDLLEANMLEFSDYEDAIQSSQASRRKINYIITRNIKDFKNSNVKAILPDDFIPIFEN